jgi:hypothetical protein
MRRPWTKQVGGVHLVEVPRAVLVSDVTAVAADHGLTFREFVELGQAGRLGDAELRDLWLMAGPALVPVDASLTR